MATEPNHLPTLRTFGPNRISMRGLSHPSPPERQRKRRPESREQAERTKLWQGATANAVYLTGSLLFLAGEMETGSMLFLAGHAAALLRIIGASIRHFRFGMLHEAAPQLLYLIGCCLFYLRDVPSGTALFIVGSLYALAYQAAPAIRARDIAMLQRLIPLVVSLIGCFFFLTSVRVVGTLLFIVSNSMLLHRSLSLLTDSRSSAADRSSPKSPTR